MPIRWVLEKKGSNDNIGITFGGPKSADSNAVCPTFIWTVKAGRMKKIDIVPGLRISKICDKWVRSAEHAARIVQFAPDGPIPIETYGKYYPVDKTTKDEKAGVALHMTKFPIILPNGVRAVQEIVEITKVNPHGMFPEVKEGHILWAINGKKITNVRQAVWLLRKKSSLRLVVLDPATLDDTIKNVVSTLPVPTSEPMHSDPVPSKEPVAEEITTPEMPTSPVVTVQEKSFEYDEDEEESVHEDSSAFEPEGDEELGPAMWC